jgi:hypothetical protein
VRGTLNSEQKTHGEDVRVRYLFGELSEEERIQFEEACFADDQHFEGLLAVEAELTDDYVRGDLVGLRRERFERQLLNTAEGQYNVEFAKTITAFPAPAPPAATSVRDRSRSDWRHAFEWLHFRSRAFQVALAAFALLLFGVGLWLIWSFQHRIHLEEAVRNGAPANIKPHESPQPPDQSTPRPPAGEHQAVATPERLRQPEPRNGNTAPGPAILSLLVVPGFDRSAGGANDLIIGPQTQTVRLQLALEADNYQSYRAVLRSVEGREILDRRGLKVRSTKPGSFVLLELPASAFPVGDFILTLSGTTSQGEVEDVHKYFLSIIKK